MTKPSTLAPSCSPPRVAATFFFRPASKAALIAPPSPLLATAPRVKRMLFGAWLSKTARNYERHKSRVHSKQLHRLAKKEAESKGLPPPRNLPSACQPRPRLEPNHPRTSLSTRL